jgi:HD-GYP domain-containing protein (c-di-GMP phosphodiesterase class II)
MQVGQEKLYRAASAGGAAAEQITDTEKLQTLLNISQLLAKHLELKPLFTEVVQQASRLVSADRSTLWLHDPRRREIYTLTGEGLERELRLPVGQGVAGIAAARGEVICIDDAYKTNLFDPQWDQRTGYTTKSLLVVPMLAADGELLGCFQAINRLDPAAPHGLGVFSAGDIALLTALAGIAAVAVENAQLYEEQKRQFNSFIVTLAQSVDARDATTSNHTRGVTGIAVAIARQLGLSHRVIERVRIAAVLHDYGKIGVPDAVLNKPGGHTDEERLWMKSHCIKSILILSRIRFGRELADIPRVAGMHHEKLDGTGYPFGLKGEEIPLEGRVLAVADIFQALIQTRPYKRGLSPQEALELCRRMCTTYEDHHGRASGVHLDGNVVDALEKVLTEHGFYVDFIDEESGWERMLAGELL